MFFDWSPLLLHIISHICTVKHRPPPMSHSTTPERFRFFGGVNFRHISIKANTPPPPNSPRPRGAPLSRPQKPRWWLPGIHFFSGIWTGFCAAAPGTCAPAVGRPGMKTRRAGASLPGRGPHSRSPTLLLLLLLPSSAPVHWGTKRK